MLVELQSTNLATEALCPSVRELQLLEELSQKLNYQLTCSDILRLCLETLDRMIPQDVCGYILRTGEDYQVSIRPKRLLAPQLMTQVQQRLLETMDCLGGQGVNLQQVSYQIAKVQQVEVDRLPLERLDSYLCMPMVFTEAEGPNVVGVLLVGVDAPDAYSLEQLQFLNRVASRGAIALSRLQSLLAVGQQRLYSMVENLPDGVLLLDTQGNILLANKTAWRYISLFTKAGCLDVILQLAKPLPDAQDVLRFCHEITLENTPRLVLEVAAKPVGTTGQTQEWQVTIRDITAYRQSETELVQSVQKLTHSNAELERFAYLAAHDLQAPLCAVSGYLKVLQTCYQHQLDAKADNFIAKAVEGAKRMQVLIEDLLNYARLESSSSVSETLDCEAVLESAIANLQSEIASTGARITHSALPQVKGNASLLIHLFQNLLSNAIKYQLPHQTPQIHIRSELKGNVWQFCIQDNGIGIEAEYTEQIFQLFKRLHSSSEYPGTGMGLAIAKKIVEQHKGQLWYSPAPQQGSCFYFTLPCS